MGLDFDNAEAHWAYSGFFRFRQRLAAAIGIMNLEQMENFGPMFEQQGPNRPLVPWDKWLGDPIVDLINHSDCDGKLSAKQCAKIAPRLREIIAPWSDDDHDKRQATNLAEGMDWCADNTKPLGFC